MTILSFEHLYFYYADFGSHSHLSHGVERSRDDSFAKVFGYADLTDVSVARLARQIRDALEGNLQVHHRSWEKQRQALRWFLNQDLEVLYATSFDIRLRPNGQLALCDGGHRALALSIRGEGGLDLVRVRLGKDSIQRAQLKAFAMNLQSPE